MHQFKWEWESITTLNQFVASVVNPFRSKNVRSIVERIGQFLRSTGGQTVTAWKYGISTIYHYSFYILMSLGVAVVLENNNKSVTLLSAEGLPLLSLP